MMTTTVPVAPLCTAAGASSSTAMVIPAHLYSAPRAAREGGVRVGAAGREDPDPEQDEEVGAQTRELGAVDALTEGEAQPDDGPETHDETAAGIYFAPLIPINLSVALGRHLMLRLHLEDELARLGLQKPNGHLRPLLKLAERLVVYALLVDLDSKECPRWHAERSSCTTRSSSFRRGPRSQGHTYARSSQ